MLKEIEMAEKRDETEKVNTTLTSSYAVKPLSQSDKKKIIGKFLGYFTSALLLTLTVFYFSWSLIGAFPDYVPISTADELLKIMIQSNGILLGFVGIVFAQLLSSLMNQQTVLYQNILENPEKANNKKEALNFLGFRRNGLSLIAVSTFFSLLLSIFISMANIARNSQFEPTDVYATFGFLFGPLLCTVIAIVLLVLAFTALPMTPQLEEE